MIGGDWPFVQRYISVPTVKDAKKSTYLIAFFYFLTPLIWYLPTMIYRVMEPGLALDVDPTTMTFNGEHAYVNMSKLVLMNGMVGMMLAAMLSATLSNVSGTLNVYANVFTYEIWGHSEKNKRADEKKRIRVGRTFTFIFGLVILGISLLVPFAGGAERVVVTILTMVICPLYIPSIWGLFSKRLSGNQLIWSMAVTWVVGFSAKFTMPTSVLSGSLLESISGMVLPVVILLCMELWSKSKGITNKGYEAINNYTDPNAEIEPGVDIKKSVKGYSHMAISVFCITIVAIALLLIGLIVVGDPKTLAAKNIVLWFIASILIMVTGYMVYRIVDKKRK
jgi:Na+/proline symporter